MSFIKKYFWLVILLVSLVLVGCKPKHNANVFQETYNKMMAQKNFQVELKINVGMGEDLETTEMVFGFDLNENNLGAVKVDTTLLGIEHQGYREFTDKEVLSYTSVPGTGTWIKKTMTKDDFNKNDINNENYFTVLTNLSNDHFVKDVTVDGTKYSVYTVKLNKPQILDDIFTVEKQNKLMKAYGLSKEQMNDYFKEVSYEVTIDPTTKILRSINVDLGEIFTKLASDYQQKNNKPATIVYDEVSLNISFSNFDKVEVTVPNKVKETVSTK